MTMNGHEEKIDDDLHEQAKKLLALTEIMDRYPAVISQRVTGMLFILIGGGVAITSLFFTSIMPYIESSGMGLFGVLLIISSSLLLSWIVVFRLIFPLTRSYPDLKDKPEEGLSTAAKIVWGVLASLMIILALYAFGTNQIILFPFFMQTLLFVGNVGNYYESRKGPNDEHQNKAVFIFTIIIAISFVPLLLFPDLGFPILILADIGGMYVMGIYLLLTAERLLVESMGK